MIELLLIAQEYSGCFYINQAGNFIDLTEMCLRNRQEIVQPISSVQIYQTSYRDNYCRLLSEGKSESEASKLAHDIAVTTVIDITGELDSLMVSDNLFLSITCD